MNAFEYIHFKLNEMEIEGTSREGTKPVFSFDDLHELLRNVEVSYSKDCMIQLGERYSSNRYKIITLQNGDSQEFMVVRR